MDLLDCCDAVRTTNVQLKGSTPDFEFLAEFLVDDAALLRALSHGELPFRLPLPLMTHSGESVAFLEQEAETLAFTVLSPFLPGEHPNPPKRGRRKKRSETGVENVHFFKFTFSTFSSQDQSGPVSVCQVGR